MKFLADMGISPRSIEYLRDLGFDAVHLHALGLDRLTDAEILQLARNDERIVLTHDLDFGELVAASQSRLPSVIIFRLRRMQSGRVNQYLDLLLGRYENELREGAILSVTEGHIRVRHLPIPGTPEV